MLQLVCIFTVCEFAPQQSGDILLTLPATQACVLSAAPAVHSHSQGCVQLCISVTPVTVPVSV